MGYHTGVLAGGSLDTPQEALLSSGPGPGTRPKKPRKQPPCHPTVWGVERMQDPFRTKVPQRPSPPSAIHSQERGALKLEPTLLNGPAILFFLGLPQHSPPRFSWGGDQAPLQPLALLILTLHTEHKQKCPGSPTQGLKEEAEPRPAQEGGPDVALV